MRGSPFAVVASVLFAAVSCTVRAEESHSATSPAARRIAFVRTEDFLQPRPGTRVRVAEHTRLYAEFQFKYGQYQNYLHTWIDRPLFWNRTLRPEKFAYETAESFAVHARELRNCGLDGFNMFAGKFGSPQIEQVKSWIPENERRVLQILPTFGYGEDGRRTANSWEFLKAIEQAIADPTFPRIDGKPLIPTYGYAVFKPEEHCRIIGTLEEKLGKDAFILCGDVDHAALGVLQRAYRKNGRLSEKETAELESQIRSVLDLAGGLQICACEFLRPFDGQYCRTYDFSFFDNCTAPVLERVMARPEYARKVLGFYVYQGYVNHMSGNDDSEDGTGTLRRYLRSVARLNPDYLLFFEWNEVNENTMYQPTVWGGRTAARILRWHSRRFKGERPDLFPGDDPAVPPLSLSYRAVFKPGEELRFELLTIPDGVFKGPLDVQLRLCDMKNRFVSDFPMERLEATRFGAVDYLVRSVDFPGDTVLVPSLVVNGRTYSGFSPLRADPTVSLNYKSVRQGLRDLLKPSLANVSVKRESSGKYAYSCDVDFNEPLSSLELISNEDEQDAAGSSEEYDFLRNYVAHIEVSTPSDGASYGPLHVRIDGVNGCVFTPQYTANINPGVPVRDADGCGFRVSAFYWTARTGWFLQVPKAALDKAVVVISRPDKPTFKPAVFPLKTLVKKGRMASVLDEATSFRVDVERFFALPDIPRPLDKSSIRWSGVTETGTRFPVYHFRAISKSGRIWRSYPMRPDAIPQEPIVTIPVWDEYAKTASVLRTPEAMVPRLVYDFDPSAGAVLLNGWDPYFNAWAGGGTWYCEPFSDGRIKVKPGCRAPKWTEEDGRACILFDGQNDYVNFPREALPQGAFTLTMEIKPTGIPDDRPMVLFRHFDFIRGSISLYIHHGRLTATWGDRDLSREPRFETGLEIVADAWNSVSVSYDFHAFRFCVNGRTHVRAWEGRPFRFKPSVFGGHDKKELAPGSPVYFKGLLRRFDIRHSAGGDAG